MQYISVKGDTIEVNPNVIQLLHRVQCIRLKNQIQAAAFMTVFTQHPEAIIRGRLLQGIKTTAINR